MENFASTLSHNIITFLIAAGTGAGKTLLCALMASKQAYNVLKRCIGITNTTLTNRSYVFSDNQYFDNRLVVHAKKKSRILKKNLVQSQMVKALASVIARVKTFENMTTNEIFDIYIPQFIKEVREKNNTKSVFTFISDEDVKMLAGVTAGVLDKIGMYERMYYIYKSAEQDLRPEEVKSHSNRFKSLIAEKASDYIDTISSDNIAKQTLAVAIDEINNKLDEQFFNYFDKANMTSEGYYVKELFLDNGVDEGFVKAFFNKNDNKDNQTMSIEAFCEEIYIFLGMNNDIKEIINSDEKIKNTFINTQTKCCEFAFYDTMGIFHKDSEEDKATDYLDGLIRSKRFAASIFLAPLKGDSNVEKVSRSINRVFESLNYSTIAFIIRNNLNKYLIDEIQNEYGFSTMSDESDEIDEKYVSKLVAELENKCKEDFKPYRNKYIEVEVHTNITELRGFDESINKMECLKNYSIKSVIKDIFMQYSFYAYKNCGRLNMEHTNDEVNIILDRDKFISGLTKSYRDLDTDVYDKISFVPAKNNLSDNYAKTPHGNSYYALVRRLQYGCGYSSNIDEVYYNNCTNINITFPDSINKIASSDVVSGLIKDAIIIKGLKCDDDKLNALIGKVKENVRVSDVSKYLVYDYALNNAEKNNYSFKSCFEALIRICGEFIDIKGGIKRQDLWADALYKIYCDALDYTFKYNVYID